MKQIKLSAKLEIIGMVIILASTAWSLSLLSKTRSIYEEARFYHIEEKLDSLWDVVTALYSVSPANTEHAGATVSFGNELKGWKVYSQNEKSMEHVASEQQLFSKIASFSFLAGSVLLILGKYLKEREGVAGSCANS